MDLGALETIPFAFQCNTGFISISTIKMFLVVVAVVVDAAAVVVTVAVYFVNFHPQNLISPAKLSQTYIGDDRPEECELGITYIHAQTQYPNIISCTYIYIAHKIYSSHSLTFAQTIRSEINRDTFRPNPDENQEYLVLNKKVT